MARKRKKSRKKPQKKIPILAGLGLAAGLALPAQSALQGNLTDAFVIASRNYLGVDPLSGARDFSQVQKGLVPLAIGVGASILASKMGANRRFTIPFFKL